MASPQLENGYVKIANELLEALMRTPLSDYENRFLRALMRKTYGYNKKQDWVADSQIVKMTGMRKQHVWRTKERLIKRKIVTYVGYRLAINKDYDEWLDSNLNRLLAAPKQVTLAAPKQVPTKDNKDNYQKTLPAKAGTPMEDEYQIEPDESVVPTQKWKKQEVILGGAKGFETNLLLAWAEERMGQKFPTPLKQKKFIAAMLNTNYTPDQIKAAWERLEADEWWADKGIDFVIVAGQIGKQRKDKAVGRVNLKDLADKQNGIRKN